MTPHPFDPAGPASFLIPRRAAMVAPQDALPGRSAPAYSVPPTNLVLGTDLLAEPRGSEEVLYLAMGCFWGVERIYWRMPGVVATSVGYLGGYTPHPTYEEVCTGRTGHAEAVRVVHDPTVVPTEAILATFFENHDPTTANRQGNDVGTQYRSGIWFTNPEQRRHAHAARTAFARALAAAGHGAPTTEIRPYDEAAAEASGDASGDGEVGRAGTGAPFHLAEKEHQQYLERHPGGYCNHGPNGLTCQVAIADFPKV